ncbi:hypothetical protein GcM3_033001 [Golovinomyces cichoracearum]|uniref:Uncharacterized protein n=1 Tax=Golovinomyces cichoracearum TaxID=62708 RepID=A0A420J4B2_9PEZI|nr:hypothetical protein GcM3_033001 [Golovinomyces cichoracearum]
MAIANVSTPVETRDITRLILHSRRADFQLTLNTSVSKILRQLVSKYETSVKKCAIDASIKIFDNCRKCSSGQRRKRGSYRHCSKDSEDERFDHSNPKIYVDIFEPQLKKFKVLPETVSEKELSSDREPQPHTSRNRPHIESDYDPSPAKQNILSNLSASSNISLSACHIPVRHTKHQEISNSKYSWASSRSEKSSERMYCNDGSDSADASSCDEVVSPLSPKSLKRAHSPVARSSTSQSTRNRSPQQYVQYYRPPPMKRIGTKDYYVYTFPMPPSGPNLTSLYYQLPPKKGNYLQVLVKFNAESNDQLWTTLLQGALIENCVKELCIAVGRMYLKSDLTNTSKLMHHRRPQDATRAINILNQNLAVGGHTLRKMVKVLIEKLKSDSIKGKWEK